MASIAADFVVIVHFLFIFFVVFGVFLTLLWPRLIWIHLLAVAWAVTIEVFGLVCPLTPLENSLRDEHYEAGFIDHYIIPLIYPSGLTPKVQIKLGVDVLLLNIGIYTWLFFRARKEK